MISRVLLLLTHLLSTIYIVYYFGDAFSQKIDVGWFLLGVLIYFIAIWGLIYHIKNFIFHFKNKRKQS
jgi:hypothetical protein